ncbi:MAG: hypothetical protein ACK6DB_02300, partial [Planctomycetota bacterium]
RSLWGEQLAFILGRATRVHSGASNSRSLWGEQLALHPPASHPLASTFPQPLPPGDSFSTIRRAGDDQLDCKGRLVQDASAHPGW